MADPTQDNGRPLGATPSTPAPFTGGLRAPRAPAFIDSTPETRELESRIARANDQLEQKLAPGQQERTRVEADMMRDLSTPAPPPPALEQTRQFQPREVSSQEMNQFGSLAMVLAGLGSLYTRQGLTGAMNASAAAMNGYREGNYAQAKVDIENWRTQNDGVIQRNTQALKEYENIMNSRQYSLTQKQGMLRVLAARENDTVALEAIKQGNLKMLLELQQKRLDGWNKYEQMSAQLGERWGYHVEVADLRRQQIDAQRQQRQRVQDRVSSKERAAESSRQSALKSMDQIGAMATPSTTGIQGTAVRWWERLGPQAGFKVTGTPANDFQSAMTALQGKLYKDLVGPGNVSKSEWARINDTIKGLNWYDNPETVRGALEQVRQIVLNSSASSVVGEARWAIEQGAPREQVLERMRNMGIDNPEQSLGY